MTEIRFRAWEKNEKRFIYWELFQGANKHTPPIFKEAELEEWQQFTNLYDKNHQGIYEGDIVKCKLYHFGFCFKEEIFIVEYGKYLRENRNAGFYPFHARINDYEIVESEIIGNIYENPELLKQEQ